MDSQGLYYKRVNSCLFFQNKENFDPVNKTFAGTHRNIHFNRRTNSKLVNYVFQRHYRDPLTEIFMNTYQQEDSITIDTEAVAVEITTPTPRHTKRKKTRKTRTIKQETKPKMESLLKLR